MKAIVAIALTIFLSACSSSPSSPPSKSMQVKKESVIYRLSEVNVNLTLGHGANPEDDKFADQKELEMQFREYLEETLQENGLLAQEDQDALEVAINIDYERMVNIGGKALNKPRVSHNFIISHNGEEVSIFTSKRYTTSYGYFKNLAVAAEIASFSWDEEDEPRDIKQVSQVIIDDLMNINF